MTRRDDRVYLRHMMDYAREAVDLSGERDRDTLAKDRTLHLALFHLVEIIGEAASQVSNEGRTKHDKIPWKGAIGMRHHIVHGYERLNVNVSWDTITDDLPRLILELERVLDVDAPGMP